MNKEQREIREQEIFDSMPRNTFEEVMAVSDAIKEFRNRCFVYDTMIYICDFQINSKRNTLDNQQKQYTLLKALAKSELGQMLRDYFDNKGITVNQIENKIHETANPFNIEIQRYSSYDNHVIRACFMIRNQDVNGYYYWPSYEKAFDIEADIAKCERGIAVTNESLSEWIQRKTEIELGGEENPLWEVEKSDEIYDSWCDGRSPVLD